MLILSARLIVIAVLAYSGLAKLGATNTASAAEDLGLSPRIAKWVGRFLAPAELLVAALLFYSHTASIGAIAALLLFATFAALVAWNLWQGHTPACACFGEASARPISGWTLARNLVFVALAGVLVAQGAATPQGVIGALTTAVHEFGYGAAMAVTFLAQAALLLAMLAQRANAPQPTAPLNSAALPAAEPVGWPTGTLAPAFDLPSLDGQRVGLPDLLARGRNVILFFTAPDCRHCVSLFPEIARWQEDSSEAATIALISRGSAAANRAKAADFGIRDLLLQGGAEVAEAYQALATPIAVVIDRDRRIASRLATGATEIRELIEAWIARSRSNAPVSVLSPPPRADPTRLLVGDPAPPFKLASVRGELVDLADLGGRIAVLIFWSPTCGHCRNFAPDLKAREKDQTETSAQMVLVSSGTRAANEAEGLVSPILLDEGGAIAKAYGSNGTPSALLVGADGRIAAALAVGQTEIGVLLQRADAIAKAARRVQA